MKWDFPPPVAADALLPRRLLGPANVLDFAQVKEVGAAALMELQKKGHAYIAW